MSPYSITKQEIFSPDGINRMGSWTQWKQLLERWRPSNLPAVICAPPTRKSSRYWSDDTKGGHDSRTDLFELSRMWKIWFGRFLESFLCRIATFSDNWWYKCRIWFFIKGWLPQQLANVKSVILLECARGGVLFLCFTLLTMKKGQN